MQYIEWFDAHAARHRAVVGKLRARGLDKAAIIAYFDFDNMVVNEPHFCPLYATKTKCHAMTRLNCYLCACPHFRFCDVGLETTTEGTRFSRCAIAAKQSADMQYGDAIHLDCSACTLPHHTGFVRRCFDDDWKRIMQRCPVG